MIETILQAQAAAALSAAFGQEISADMVALQTTDAKFEGDFTIVVFPFVKMLGQKPNVIAESLGKALTENANVPVIRYNVVGGFCNLVLSDDYWLQFAAASAQEAPKNAQSKQKTIVVEYASPNTNKPLHLGHVRNILLGYSTANILEAAGYSVKKVQIVNDRGIHICKSMLAWQKFGEGETPESSKIKGDHLVGKYYVRFEQEFQAEYKAWQETSAATTALYEWRSSNYEKIHKKLAPDNAEEQINTHFFKEVFKNTYFNTRSPLGAEAKQMLQDWEEGKTAVVELWRMMNGWVYEGFGKTYERMGVNFDKLYYESETYLHGKSLIEENLQKSDSIFYKKEDGSIWIDLSSAKLDHKAVLRSDGTSMYITQDLGTAKLRFDDFDMDKMIYVVGNEQEYHFQVLFEILRRLGFKFSKDCYHLSYGMVHLPEGRMKSREGTVVDADDLMKLLYHSVCESSLERNTLADLSEAEQAKIKEQVAQAALKFFMLKVEAVKNMVFDPKESIDLQGHTGPYIQNAYVRTQGVERRLANADLPARAPLADYSPQAQEKELLRLLHALPSIIQKAADTQNPAELANYMYNLARAFHRFYNDLKIIDAQNAPLTYFRIDIVRATAHTLRYVGDILGIEMPERM